jgi:hypothetical protein
MIGSKLLRAQKQRKPRKKTEKKPLLGTLADYIEQVAQKAEQDKQFNREAADMDSDG